MASRLLFRSGPARLLVGGVTLGGAGFAANSLWSSKDQQMSTNEAVVQFNTPFGYKFYDQTLKQTVDVVKVPPGWTGRTFELSNQYTSLPQAIAPDNTRAKGAVQQDSNPLPPLPGPGLPGAVLDPLDDAPWLDINYEEHPYRYCNMIKAYCWDGFVGNANNPDYENRFENENYNPFLPKYNTRRPWFHAPWMHASINGRECLNGLTFERATPPQELASTQKRQLQNWACGFYNAAGATVFGDVWKDPTNPQWDNVQFPLGTCVFKILLSDATNEEVFTMKGAPGIQAVIAQQKPGQILKNGEFRNDYPSTVRLIQVDFAVREDRAPTGWVFGTFMYDGSRKDKDPWDRIIPVGIMWGNDPELTPKLANAGQKPKESWINPEAETLRKQLKGNRPSWGWNGRMNGPADYFRSACSSCHAVSSWTPLDAASRKAAPAMVWDSPCLSLPKAKDRRACRDKIPVETRMEWFRNIKPPQTWSGNGVDKSGDYSLQLQIGYYNYVNWCKQNNVTHDFAYQTKLAMPNAENEAKLIEAKREPRSVGMIPDDEDVTE